MALSSTSQNTPLAQVFVPLESVRPSKSSFALFPLSLYLMPRSIHSGFRGVALKLGVMSGFAWAQWLPVSSLILFLMFSLPLCRR